MTWAIVRVRGTVNVIPDITRTLQLLRLNRVNHCVIVPENDSYRGMLQIAKDYVTWGEIDAETTTQLLTERGRLDGDRPLDGEALKGLGFDDHAALATALVNGSATLSKLEGVKPLLRLHPPHKGYEGIKRSFREKGALGYRGAKINDLLRRMCHAEA